MTSSSLRSGNASDEYQDESGVLDTCTVEERLSEALDNLLAKSSKTRLHAFETMRKALSENYLFDYVFNTKVTILDTLSRSLGKRSQGQDLGFAANLVALVCSTIGSNPETDPMFDELIRQLSTHLNDVSIQPDVRSKCARSIAISSFIIGIENYLEHVMQTLFAIFNASCAKGDRTMPNPSDQIASFHTACLKSWTLLLTAIQTSAPHVALEIVEQYMDKITELLDSPNLELKCCAGESLAIMFEIIKFQDVHMDPALLDEFCDKIREIMLDSQKFKAKKDLKHQRSNFREILASIEDDELPNITIKIHTERLVLNSWARRRQYDAFCEIFGTGMSYQLSENECLRDIFDMGPVVSPLDIPKIRRSEHSHENMLADKIRTKNLRKLRDNKRADFLI